MKALAIAALWLSLVGCSAQHMGESSFSFSPFGGDAKNKVKMEADNAKGKDDIKNLIEQ